MLFARAAGATPPCDLPWEREDLLLAPAATATEVPRNATPVLRFLDVAPTLSVDGSALPFDETRLDVVTGFGAHPFRRLWPAALLPPNSTIAIDPQFDGVRTFVTGTDVDTTAPTAPVLGDVAPWSEGACTPFVAIEVGAQDDVALYLARRDAAPSLEPGAEAHGLSLRGSIVVAGPANASAEIFVSAVDAAGNLGDPSVVVATFPDELAPLCSHSGPPPTNAARAPTLGLLALLAGAWLRARRAAGQR